jgi:hypothetical protein
VAAAKIPSEEQVPVAVSLQNLSNLLFLDIYSKNEPFSGIEC